MPGTKEGARKMVATSKAKYGDDHFKRIGSIGGSAVDVPKGFASGKIGSDGLTGRQRARLAGAKGGKISKRTKKETV